MREQAITLAGNNSASLLDGTTTQALLLLHPQPTTEERPGGHYWRWTEPPGPGRRRGLSLWPQLAEFLVALRALCPYGQVGDRLWVREPWRVDKVHDARKPADLVAGDPVWYEVDGPPAGVGRYRHAAHLPRWASRVVLELLEVRVIRAWDIEEADACALGIQAVWAGSGLLRKWRGYSDSVGGLHVTAKAAYRSFWLTVRGASWHGNPWVWLVKFKQVPEGSVPDG